MAFRKKASKILELNPDLIVLQECEHKSKLLKALPDLKYNQIIWHGRNEHKGVCVISFNDWEIELKSHHNEDIDYFLPLRLKGTREIDLYAIWAMPYKGSTLKSYVGRVWAGIHHYRDQLNDDAILIGDYNSNAIWDKGRSVGKHTDVVAFLKEKNIVSFYHKRKRATPGKEKDATFYMYKKLDKPYHIDYCFATESLLTRKVKLKIGDPAKWMILSDHMPLIIDKILE